MCSIDWLYRPNYTRFHAKHAEMEMNLMRDGGRACGVADDDMESRKADRRETVPLYHIRSNAYWGFSRTFNVSRDSRISLSCFNWVVDYIGGLWFNWAITFNETRPARRIGMQRRSQDHGTILTHSFLRIQRTLWTAKTIVPMGQNNSLKAHTNLIRWENKTWPR